MNDSCDPGTQMGVRDRAILLLLARLALRAGDSPAFATIRLRKAKTRNCLSEKSALSLVHQPAMSAGK